MAERPRSARQKLARMAQQHIDSLRAAGVDWVPVAPDEQPATAGAALFQDVLGPAPVSTEPSQSADERRIALQTLASQISTCPRCAELASTRTQTVFGVGKVDPEVCFIGEAPGADEDAQGEPFVGAAGQLLNRIIAACGWKREEVYICNILKCRPPGNRTPLPNEAANCREYLEKQLEWVCPKYIVALGACAAQNLLNTTISIGRLRGQFQEYRGIPVLCTYHPAYLLRNPASKKDVWDDMKKLLRQMGRPVP